MRKIELTGLSKEGNGGGEKGEGIFFEDWQTGEWMDYFEDSWHIRPQAFLRQIGPGILGPDKLGSGKLGPGKLSPWILFVNLAPKITLAANWTQKILCSKYITLIKRLNNCGECDSAWRFSVFIFATFSSMRPYRALKALNSQFHLNIWTHL